jgi:hypothetical protein
MINKISLFLLVLVVAFSGCKKDSESSLSKTDMLTGTTWKLSKFSVVAPGTTVTVDYTSLLPSCLKDNVTNFSKDKKYTVKEGATKCSTSDTDLVEEGTWAFSSDEKKLTMTTDGVADEFTIKSLSSSQCVLTGSDVTLGSIEVTYVK